MSDVKRPLYKLPTLGRMGLRMQVLSGLLLGMAGVLVAMVGVTQWTAHHFDYPKEFGAPASTPMLPAGLAWACFGALMLAVVGLAWMRRYTPALLMLLFGAAGICWAALPIYAPWQFMVWIKGWDELPAWAGYHAWAWRAFWIGCGVAVVAAVAWMGWHARRLREPTDAHGSAKWATTSDIEEAGLFAKRGVVLGAWERRGRAPRLIRVDGAKHVFVQGPPRSGKGVGLIVPTAVSFHGSALVHDAKGELWGLTAGWRASELGNLCLRFDPTSTSGEATRYNPLFEIRPGPREMGDTQNLCDVVLDPHGDAREDHWTRSARDLLTMAVLHTLYLGRDKTLRGVVQLLSGQESVLGERPETFRHMLELVHESPHLPVPQELRGALEREIGSEAAKELTAGPSGGHPAVVSLARSMLNKEDRELSGVQSTALALLSLYRDPVVAANCSESDFRLDELLHAKDGRPRSLYLTIPAADTKRARPLVRVLLTQALHRLTEDLEVAGGRATRAAKSELLLLLDELPLLGRLPMLQEILAFGPGYGIRGLLAVQGLSQHRAVYAEGGRHESIVDSCDIRCVLGANDPVSAEFFSKLAGVQTVEMEQRDYRGARFDLVLNEQYIRRQHHQRPLVTPDEILRLPADDILIFARSARPIRATRVKSYEDPEFRKRSQRKPPRGRPRKSDRSEPGFWELLARHGEPQAAVEVRDAEGFEEAQEAANV